MNIVIPMAGAGSRFVAAGYNKPKPFIDVDGKTMIELVLQNLATPKAHYILIIQPEHISQECDAVERIKREYNCHIVTVGKLTEGAACTVLLASAFINNDEELLLANSDQIVDIDIKDFVDDARQRDLDGSILTFTASHPKWSYVKVDENGLMTELKEKQVISANATVGLYYYKRGSDFVNAAVAMIAHNDRVNNEFYVAPVYNYAVKDGKQVGIYPIGDGQMHGLGTPEDLHEYRRFLGGSPCTVSSR